MRSKLLPALLVLVLLGGCGEGGGGSGPTSPPPVPNANINGVWVGTASTVSARGTCLESGFQPVTVTAVWTIRQSGSSFSAVQVLNNAQLCAFTGTVRGNAVTFSPDLRNSDAVCGVQNLVCSVPGSGPVRIELNTGRSVMSGIVEDNLMTITSTSVWRVFDSGSGQSLGDHEISGRQTLQR